jgi:hypothetical protein
MELWRSVSMVQQGDCWPTSSFGLFSLLAGVLLFGSGIGMALEMMLMTGCSDLRLHIKLSLLPLSNCLSKSLHCSGFLVFFQVSQLTLAFVISGVVALLSLLVLIPATRQAVENVAAGTEGHVDDAADETSRLLGGGHA